MTYKREQEVAEKISDLINNMCLNEKEVCKAMCNEHRTLQQNFTRLCIEWLKTCASEDYRHDGRNEDSHHLAQEIVNAYDHNHTETSVEHFKDIFIPYI